MTVEQEEQVLALSKVSSTRQAWLHHLADLFPTERQPDNLALFWQELITLLASQGQSIHQIWSFEAAISELKQADRLFEAFAFSVNLGLCLDRMALHRQAIQVLQQALRTLNTTWTPDWPQSIQALRAITRHNLATAYLNEGKTRLAITHNKAALRLKQAMHDEPGQITILIGLANAYRDQGLYRLAERLYHQALVLAHRHVDKQAAAKCALGLGNIHMVFLDYTLAIRWYQKALANSESPDHADDLPTIYVALGNAFHHAALKDVQVGEIVPSEGIDQLVAAMTCYKQALAVMGDDDPLAMADVLLKCGHVAIDLNVPHAAEQSYSTALKLVKSFANHAVQFEIMSSLGNLALFQHKYSKALTWYQQTLLLSQQDRHSEHESIANANVGRAHLEQGNFKRAIPFLEASILLSEQLGYDLVSEAQKMGYFTATQADYEVLIHAYLTVGNAERAFYYLEKNKAKILLSILGIGNKSTRNEAIPTALRRKEQSLRQVIRAQLLSGIDSADLTASVSKLNKLYQQIELLAPEYVSLCRGDALSFEAVQKWISH